jgi:hypothetical protein
MKSTVLVLIYFLFSIYSVFSQDWFVGGGVSLEYVTSSNPQNANNKITAEILPSLGYKINSKFDIGFGLFYQYEKNNSDYLSNTSYFGVDLFSRYSFLEVNKFSLLGRFDINYAYAKRESVIRIITNYPSNTVTREIEKENIQIISIRISPVFQYELFDNILLFASIGSLYYSHLWSDNDYKTNYFGLSLTTGLTLGFYIVF